MKFGRRASKNALKELGLEQTEENIAKLGELFGSAPATEAEKTEELIVTHADENLASIIGIVSSNDKYLLVRVPVNLTNAEILGTFDNEPRAVFARREKEVELKLNAFREEQKREQKREHKT